MLPIFKSLRITCVWTIVFLIPNASTAQNGALHIAIISGQDAAHPAGAHVVKPITIEVTDAAGQPVEGARTSFQLPEEGPGGVLASGLKTDLAVTDSHGRATLRGFQLNRTAGPFNVRVTVAKEQARAGIVVRQRIGEVGAATGSADREAQPAAEPVPPVKVTSSKAEPVKATPATIRPTGAMVPRAIEASAQTAPVIRPAVTESAGAAARPARTQTIVVTQKPPRAGGGAVTSSGGKSHKKWVLLGILAAGGAAGAFASSNLGAASAAHNPGLAPGLNSSVSIGTPTITIGKP